MSPLQIIKQYCIIFCNEQYPIQNGKYPLAEAAETA